MRTSDWFKAGLGFAGAARHLAPVLLLLASSVHALEFQYSNPFPEGPLAGVARKLTISGELLPGDTEQFKASMRRNPVDAWYALGRVEMAITGGDIAEAMLLAELLAPLYPHTVATADCAGACAIVWLSGAWRLLPVGRIGLQKPGPAPTVNSTTPRDAPPLYDTRMDLLRDYLYKQGLPPPVFQRWSADRNERVYWLSAPEVNATGTWPPYYYDKLKTRCPPLDATEESYHALRRCAGRLVISQKAFAFDKILSVVKDPWWSQNKDELLNAPR
ncbi:hypothetical protein [Polaromonas sp. A23]|uniref:hypothetical protein n=1 Tax=Polaromonas sp. A23 TaxID=1944133 RepID=UPI000986DC10|nr:hypothetical protein [Polaromonas sp. A23]OOG46602.1 hypothetical protein B0B52_02940 [Polaromonas sp. A23]